MTRQSTKQQTIQPECGVTRIYRVASKIGEDFHTVEMTVTLPVGATDAEIAEAIDLGTRIYGCLPLGVKARTVYGRDETPRFSGFSPKSHKLANFVACATLQICARPTNIASI